MGKSKSAFDRKFNQGPSITNTVLIRNMYQRVLTELCINRFKWMGLPETVDPMFLEKTLFFNALSVFYRDERYDKFMAVQGSAAGNWNMYDNPTRFQTVGAGRYRGVLLNAVPYYASIRDKSGKFTGEKVRMQEDCVPIWANAMRRTDMDIVRIYATKLAEADTSLDINTKNARHTKILVVSDNKRLSGVNVNRQIDQGDTLIQLAMDSMDLIPTALDLGINEHALEKLQIVRKGIWNECMGLLGIDNANQDKKERMVASEVDANNDQVSNMRYVNLNARRQAAHMINQRWPELKISVEFSSDVDAKMNSSEANNSIERDDQFGGEE